VSLASFPQKPIFSVAKGRLFRMSGRAPDPFLYFTLFGGFFESRKTFAKLRNFATPALFVKELSTEDDSFPRSFFPLNPFRNLLRVFFDQRWGSSSYPDLKKTSFPPRDPSPLKSGDRLPRSLFVPWRYALREASETILIF